MLDRVADLVLARPKPLLGLFLALVVCGGVYGRDVATSLSPAGYEVGGSESTAALTALADRFDTGPANLVLLVDSGEGGDVDDAEVVAAAEALAAQLRDLPDVADVATSVLRSYRLQDILLFLNRAVFPVALAAAVLHPQSREYQRVWFE